MLPRFLQLLLRVGLWMAAAASALRAGPVHHELAPDSHLLDACPICGRPDIPLPLTGGFDLEPVSEDPLFTTYAVRRIDLRGRDLSGGELRITGDGDLVVGGEVAVTHRMHLRLTLSMAGTNIVRTFTNDLPGLSWHWPNLGTDLTAEETLPTQVFHLRLRTVPAREVWFLTRHGMTSGNSRPPFERYEGGDVLARDGRRIRHLGDLLGRLGIMPPVPPLAIDTLTVLPGGEVAFSLRDPVFSETLGDLGDGDLVAEGGRVVARNRELLQSFRPAADSDAGLDAWQELPDGEILFSVARPVPLPGGSTLEPGDILSNRGRVVHRLKDLLAPFAPEAEFGDPGMDNLDALHVWPSGEVWFSVSGGFPSGTVGRIGDGDLLSSHGWVVWRSLDLVAPFQPLEDLADFGLTGVFVVTDLAPPPGPAFLYRPEVVRDGIDLEWSGPGRVFQLETAVPDADGIRWEPAGPPSPDRQATWTRDAAGAVRWLRVRSW